MKQAGEGSTLPRARMKGSTNVCASVCVTEMKVRMYRNRLSLKEVVVIMMLDSSSDAPFAAECCCFGPFFCVDPTDALLLSLCLSHLEPLSLLTQPQRVVCVCALHATFSVIRLNSAFFFFLAKSRGFFWQNIRVLRSQNYRLSSTFLYVSFVMLHLDFVRLIRSSTTSRQGLSSHR